MYWQSKKLNVLLQTSKASNDLTASGKLLFLWARRACCDVAKCSFARYVCHSIPHATIASSTSTIPAIHIHSLYHISTMNALIKLYAVVN